MSDCSSDTAALASELRVAVLRLARRIKARRAPGDLSDRCFSVLFALAAHGPMAPSTLAEREHVRPPSMTRTIAALTELGLVTRTAHPLDGRQVVISLTELGRKEVDETIQGRERWLGEQLGTLTKTERDVLARAATIMGRLTD